MKVELKIGEETIEGFIHSVKVLKKGFAEIEIAFSSSCLNDFGIEIPDTTLFEITAKFKNLKEILEELK